MLLRNRIPGATRPNGGHRQIGFSKIHRCRVHVAAPVKATRTSAVNRTPAAARQTHRRRAVVVTALAGGIELQVVKEEVSNVKRRLNITVPAAGVKQCFHKAVEKMRNIVGDLPGFRRDKIPLSIIITNCGGQRNFKMTCIEEVLLTAMPLAMEEVIKVEGVVPETERVVTSIDEMEAAFDPAKPLTFTVEYDTVPPLVWKKDYKDIHVTIRDNGDFSTDEAGAEQFLRELLKESGHQNVIIDRGLQQGDTAIADLKITEKGSKLPLPGLSSSKTRFDTDMDPLDLTPHLLGAKVGETRKFNIILPDDYRIDLWQGMECDVEFTVKELFSWTLPEFNDEFVKATYPGRFESAAELKKSLLATTTMERVQVMDGMLGDAVKQAVVECVEAPALPESIVEDMAVTQYRAAILEMIEKKMATQEEVEKLLTEEMVKEYMQKKRKQLEAAVIFNMAADEIWAKENMTVDKADVDAEVKMRKEQYEAQKLEYDEEAIRGSVVDTMKHLKVVEWLKDNVKRDVLPYKG